MQLAEDEIEAEEGCRDDSALSREVFEVVRVCTGRAGRSKLNTHTNAAPRGKDDRGEERANAVYMVIFERRRKGTLNSQLRIEGIARRSFVLGGFAEEELFYKMGKGFGFWVRVGKGKG